MTVKRIGLLPFPLTEERSPLRQYLQSNFQKIKDIFEQHSHDQYALTHDHPYAASVHNHTSDTGWINTNVTTGGGFSDAGIFYRVRNGVVYIRALVLRTGGNLGGNFVNVVCFGLPASVSPSIAIPFQGNNVSGAGGIVGFLMGTNGVVDAVITDSGATWATNNQVQALFSYPL